MHNLTLLSHFQKAFLFVKEFAAKEKLEIVKERGEALNFLGFAVAPSEARGENRPS